MVSEIKRHYRLNMLKNFIDQEANTVKSGSKSGNLPGSKSANTKEEKQTDRLVLGPIFA